MTAGHQVTLLTSDQGLARMALAEGMRPLFFRAAKASAFLGRRLAGTNLHPFTGEMYTVSIPAVLWELATIFGTARLATADHADALVVDAIGEDLAWTPYHSYDDLLWISAKRTTPDAARTSDSPASVSSTRDDYDVTMDSAQSRPSLRKQPDVGASPPPRPHLYRVSIDRLFRLVDALETDQRLPIGVVAATLGLRVLGGIGEYRRYLQSRPRNYYRRRELVRSPAPDSARHCSSERGQQGPASGRALIPVICRVGRDASGAARRRSRGPTRVWTIQVDVRRTGGAYGPWSVCVWRRLFHHASRARRPFIRDDRSFRI